MASLFKRNKLAPLPPGAEIRERKGERLAHWTDPDNGKARKAEVITTPKGEKIIVSQARQWSGKVNLGKRKWQTVTLFSDKTASERRLDDLQKTADRRAAGCIAPDAAKIGLPINELVKQYHDALRLRKSDVDHIRISEWMLARLIELGEWQYFADISLRSVEKILHALDAQGKTASYQNKFVARARAFTRWALPEGWPDPLKRLHRVKEKGGKRTRERRAATDANIAALMLIDLPDQRRLAYAFAAFNGLRRNELEDLTWERIHLDATIPFVGLPQKQGSDDTLDSVPIHPYVLGLLRERMALPAAKVLRAVPDVATLQKDWKRSGVEFLDDKKRRLDFHALRHTFETQLDRVGCSRATKKKLMRHANEDVTDGYAHAELSEMLAALNRIKSPAAMPVRMIATGTADGRAHHISHHATGLDGQTVAATGERTQTGAAACSVEKVPYNPATGGNSHPQSGIDQSNSIAPMPLGPSTQVGYGEYQKTSGNTQGFPAAHHISHHAHQKTIAAIVDLLPSLTDSQRLEILARVRRMIATPDWDR